MSTGVGLFVLGLADERARMSTAVSTLPLFWVAMFFIAVPTIWRLLAYSPTRNERITLLLVLGLAMYLIKIMASPLGFTLPDEFSHLRTLNDILTTGHLFEPNPLLPVSPFYPGLEALTAAASASTGMDTFSLAMVLMGAARVVAVLSLFHIADAVSRSARVASVASLIYMGNLSFLTFDAQFSYESLALPLALVAIWAVLVWSRHSGRSPMHGSLALGAIGVTTMTHPLTSLALLAFLGVWAVLSVLHRSDCKPRWPILVAAGWSAVTNITWFVTVGGLAISYLNIIILGGIDELLSVLQGNLPPKQLFVARPEFALPPYEIAVAYGAVLLLLAGLPFMLVHAVRRRPLPAVVVMLGLAALAYPASLALRFTATGSETSQRAAEFLFLPLGVLGSDWLIGSRSARWRPRGQVLLVFLLFVIFAGGVVSGDPPQGRLPGPYRAAAEQLSIEPQGISAAEWALSKLGPNHRIITDRINGKLMGSIGSQYPVTAANQHLGTAYVMFRQTLNPEDIQLLRDGDIRYVVVDLRLARYAPVYKYYFESAEPDAGRHTTPMPLAALQKFDRAPGVTRIYDSGDIVIYDVLGLYRERLQDIRQ